MTQRHLPTYLLAFSVSAMLTGCGTGSTGTAASTATGTSTSGTTTGTTTGTGTTGTGTTGTGTTGTGTAGTGTTGTGTTGTGSTGTTGTGSTGTGTTGTGTGTGSTGTGTGTTGTGTTTAAVTVATSSRLLDQTTFGPTSDSIAHVQSLGTSALLAEQFATPATVLANLPTPLPTQCTNNPTSCFESEAWQAMLTGPDQLRQRVAFTLGELFVTSTQSVNAYAMVPYWNTLSADAFTNWRTIMQDVALSPAMGLYLNMIHSGKPAAGQHANENWSRELMQLFSIGLVRLNTDGTVQVDSTGTPLPSFTEKQVEAFADTFTGWTYATAAGTAPTTFPNNTANYYSPMAAVDKYHDTTTKTLLNGTVVSAGGTATGDLKIALDNIFNDSNLPPFVCKQLIQHLVTSTPSPAYVRRVSSVFIDNGSGVRGDMKAVLTAILTDTEARAGDTNAGAAGGHLREPMLFLTGALRALGYTSTNTDATNLWAYMSLSGYTAPLGEQPMRSPSVFNFYPPEYVIPGTDVNAPEFSLENTASVTLRLSLANSLSTGSLNGFKTDLSKTSTLGVIAADPAKITDTLGVLFMHGQMPADMRGVIINTVSGLTDYGQRVRVATYLILTSSQYKVMH